MRRSPIQRRSPLGRRSPLKSDRQVLGERYEGWLKDPVTFCTDNWGSQLWAAQENLIRTAWTVPKLAVKAGHGVGKSYVLSRLAIAFLVTYPQSKVITTAPTWTQVEKILWSEIRTAVRTAKYPVGGDPLTVELRLADDWFALGMSTDELDRFQGFHAPHVLVIFDEASGIPQGMWEAADSLMVGSHSHWVVVGNPLEPSGPFYHAFQSGSPWSNITISCEDCPNVRENREVIPGLVGREWVDAKRREWGEDSPLFASRVLGQFPAIALSHVIERSWVLNCLGRYLPPTFPQKFLTIDVADMGDDHTVMYVWDGPKILKSTIYGKVEAMQSAGNAVALAKATDCTAIIGDAGGLGAPVMQRIRELAGSEMDVIPVNGAEKSMKEEFRNMRAEVWFTAGQLLQEGQACLPDDPTLMADLTAPVYTIRSGKILIQDKDEIKRELGRSPDQGDACVLGLWYASQPKLPKPYVRTETSSQRAMREADEGELVTQMGHGYGDV